MEMPRETYTRDEMGIILSLLTISEHIAENSILPGVTKEEARSALGYFKQITSGGVKHPSQIPMRETIRTLLENAAGNVPKEPECKRCNDTGIWYGGADLRVEYPCDHKPPGKYFKDIVTGKMMRILDSASSEHIKKHCEFLETGKILE